MARKQSTSPYAHSSNNSDHSPIARRTTSGRALYLVPTVADADDTRCILQSDLLLAAFDWTKERGWRIRYFVNDAPGDVQGASWRALYFDGGETPVATSKATRHPSLRLLGEGDRLVVWRVARTVLHQLEAGLARELA